MTPPEGQNSGSKSNVPAVSSSLTLRRMRTRSEFLAAARAQKQGTKGMMVQVRARCDDDATVGVGFTCSKKVGNAVARNRAKRRLREVARLDLPGLAQPGHDYVLIGRPGDTADRPFTALRADLAFALKRLHGSS